MLLRTRFAAAASAADGPVEAGITVPRVEGLPADFINGVDVSSVLSLEESGVVFRDAAGEPVTAVVGCTENVLSEAPDGTDAGFAGGRAVATKTLVRAAGGWKVLSHHASPVLMPDDDEDDE